VFGWLRRRQKPQFTAPLVEEPQQDAQSFHWFRYEKDGLWHASRSNSPTSRYDTGGCASRAALDEVIASCEQRWNAPVNMPPPELDQHERERRNQAATAAHLLSRMSDDEIAAVVRAAEITRSIAGQA
jgi:hypothetical protein